MDITDLEIDYFANRLGKMECHLLIVMIAAFGLRSAPFNPKGNDLHYQRYHLDTISTDIHVLYSPFSQKS